MTYVVQNMLDDDEGLLRQGISLGSLPELTPDKTSTADRSDTIYMPFWKFSNMLRVVVLSGLIGEKASLRDSAWEESRLCGASAF